VTNPTEASLRRLHQRAATVERQLEGIEALMAHLPAGALAAFGSTLADHQHQLDELAACLIDGTVPTTTIGVQARLARHTTEDQT